MSGIDFDHFREHIYTIELNDGATAKMVSLWIAFAAMAAFFFTCYHKVPWSSRTQQRLCVLPFLTTLRPAIFYLMMALDRHKGRTCRAFHLASFQHKAGPDDWQQGAVKGVSRLEVCHLPAGPEQSEWRLILLLWVCELVTFSENSLEIGGLAFGLITIFGNNSPSQSSHWTWLLKTWPWATGAGFLCWSIYKMTLLKNDRARAVFFSLIADLFAIVELHKLQIVSFSRSKTSANLDIECSSGLERVSFPQTTSTWRMLFWILC
jgi:hypothetical protein